MDNGNAGFQQTFPQPCPCRSQGTNIREKKSTKWNTTRIYQKCNLIFLLINIMIKDMNLPIQARLFADDLVIYSRDVNINYIGTQIQTFISNTIQDKLDLIFLQKNQKPILFNKKDTQHQLNP